MAVRRHAELNCGGEVGGDGTGGPSGDDGGRGIATEIEPASVWGEPWAAATFPTVRNGGRGGGVCIHILVVGSDGNSSDAGGGLRERAAARRFQTGDGGAGPTVARDVTRW
jgi:hypothetical protein